MAPTYCRGKIVDSILQVPKLLSIPINLLYCKINFNYTLASQAYHYQLKSLRGTVTF